MKADLNTLLSRFGIKSARTKNITKHVFWSFLYKGGYILANFLLVPLTINYLDVENYGIWLTLSSFIAWFSFFDIGLGNGLRNKFAEAKSLGNYNEAQGFVSTAYFTVAFIASLLFIIFLILNVYVDWTSIFNTSKALGPDLSRLMPIVFGLFCLQLMAKLIISIYQADQNHSIQGKVSFITAILSLFIVWILTQYFKSSLLVFGLVISVLPVLILIALSLFAFHARFEKFKPKFALWKRRHLKDIAGLGFNFFIIQIAALVLFSTDNFIISKLFSPAEVVPYNISFKYFSLITMAYTILITPYWSSFTEAYAQQDFDWIKRSVNNIQKIWYFVPFLLLIMIVIADWFYELWVGDEIMVPIHLSISMAIFVLLLTFNMIYVHFINGVGKIRLQLFTSIVSMVINIPLSILFSKYLGWGLSGVILATIFSLSYCVILWPIQYSKIINGKAKGIWNA